MYKRQVGIVPTGDFYGDGCVGSQNAAVSWTESATSDVNTRLYPAMGVAFDAALDLKSGRVAVVGGVETDWVLVLDEEFEGTFTVLQVPSLLGARYGAPYMHDGRAADLEAAIEDMLVNAAVPVKATAQQREALLAVLMSL
ncbi:MAG: hypothetical protein KUG77_09380 [Nannocystaceae bacterium]|nr:hypothetical protein [Nannocystaceae bacterium]